MNTRIPIVIISTLVATNIASVIALGHTKGTDAAVQAEQSKQATYSLLSKRILINNPNDVIINFAPLRDALNQYFATNIPGEHSFYFEYLPTGTSIRIDSNNELIGASLLKLPVAMNAYKASELGKVSLDQKVTLKQEWLDEQFGDLYKRGAGAQLSLRELVEIVLRDSDNTAVNAVQATVNPLLAPDQHALVELDVPHTITDQERVKIGAQSYTLLLKCLYLSCFIDNDDSQQVLKYMAEAPDSGRIAAGVPQNVTVAHKIGTFGQQTEADCGNIYADSRPYALCMIVDEPDPEASRHIKEVSALVYQYISAQK